MSEILGILRYYTYWCSRESKQGTLSIQSVSCEGYSIHNIAEISHNICIFTQLLQVLRSLKKKIKYDTLGKENKQQ